jgi:hypothetical protein
MTGPNVAYFTLLSRLVAAALGIALLGEVPTPPQLLGGALVLAAAAFGIARVTPRIPARSCSTPFALQATNMGYVTHAMAGIDRERAPRELRLPDGFHLEVAIAVGRRALDESLPDDLRELEMVSERRPVDSFTWAGPYETQSKGAE